MWARLVVVSLIWCCHWSALRFCPDLRKRLYWLNYFTSGDITCICNQFVPRSGLTKCQAWSGSKLFDSTGFWKNFFKKKIQKEKNQTACICKTVCTQIRPHKMSGLIWIQTVWLWKNFLKRKFWRKKIRQHKSQQAKSSNWLSVGVMYVTGSFQ